MPISAGVNTLAWLPDAPGMFVTGGMFIDLIINLEISNISNSHRSTDARKEGLA